MKLAFVVIDGMAVDLAQRMLPELPFLSSRISHQGVALSSFPSTTGPAYFPLLAGCTPGRANVPGIRWFDRSMGDPGHAAMRSYVGPAAQRMQTDTKVATIFSQHAWPASSPVAKDLPKKGEIGRDAVWTLAHFTHLWGEADHRTARKLGRGLRKGREIVFAVFPSVDELGHVHGTNGGHLEVALRRIDALLAERLADFDGELVVTADHGLTGTHAHLDLRAIVEGLVGPTVAFPFILKWRPVACVCESGNGMANVYLRVGSDWRNRPGPAPCREVARQLLAVEGVDSVALRGDVEGSAELWTRDGHAKVGFAGRTLFARGPVITNFEHARPDEALALSFGDRWPDAAFALTSIFASPRAGDLLVSAQPGYDLRGGREWPEHHASHGALRREHTLVPLWSSAPLPDGHLRTLDVFAYALRLTGIPLARYPSSDSAQLALGTWRPAVAR